MPGTKVWPGSTTWGKGRQRSSATTRRDVGDGWRLSGEAGSPDFHLSRRHFRGPWSSFSRYLTDTFEADERVY